MHSSIDYNELATKNLEENRLENLENLEENSLENPKEDINNLL